MQYINSFIGHIVGYPTTWIAFYFLVLIPLCSWRISKDYFNFKKSNDENEEKMFRRLVMEIWGSASLSILLLYLLFKITFHGS